MDNYIEVYGRRLYGLCMNLCRERGEADDLYQETWLKVLQHFDQYDQSLDFEPWIAKICINTYKDICRRRKRSPFFDFFQSNEEKDAVMGMAPGQERNYVELKDAVDRLDEKLRMTVILFYFNGLDQKQTAEILNVPLGTVKSRLSTARKQLREMMMDE